MTISVVIASYKYGHLAAHCIESVLSQTRKPDRVFFVDDGVGDCRHIPMLYGELSFTQRKKNLGVVENFQDMLMSVETDKCLFLGADNWLRSDALELLSEEHADIVTYDIMVTGELKDEILNRHPKQVVPLHGDHHWRRIYKHHGSMLYNAKMAKRVGGYSRSKDDKTEEDRMLWEKMLSAGASIAYVPEPLLYYRRHRENFYKYEKPQ